MFRRNQIYSHFDKSVRKDEDSKFIIVGDVHGMTDKYAEMVKRYRHSLQVGDMGFGYKDLKKLDPENHKFIGGNHDNYDIINDCPNNLGDFGTWNVPDFGDIWFMRGAWSIDRLWRTVGISWWENEELTREECEKAVDHYLECKPDIVVTHDCPRDIYPYVGVPLYNYSVQKTPEALQLMFNKHKPKAWIFGHHHQLLMEEIEGTQFVCLPEMCGLEIDLEKGDKNGNK